MSDHATISPNDAGNGISPTEVAPKASHDVATDASTDPISYRRLKFGTEALCVSSKTERNAAEADVEIGQIRLKVLLPFALARLGRTYEILDEATGQMIRCGDFLPLRRYVDELAHRLACGTDLIFELVNRICAHGPENVRAADLLKHAPSAGKGTSRLSETLEQALGNAVLEVCVEQGRKPGTVSANKAIREHMRAAGVAGRLPGTHTIKKRTFAPAITIAREDAYARDHLNRIAGNPDEIQGLMEVVMLDTTQFTNDEYELRVVDEVGRDMGPANVIFGIMGSNRGIWTFRGFAGAPNGYLAGLAIKRGLVSKQPLLERYGIRGVWPFHGKPGELKHDNGSEFLNEHVQRVLKDLSIGFDDKSPPATPHHRGTNERFNRTAHSLFERFLRSDVGRRYQTTVRGKPTAIGITLKNFDRALAEWIVSDYHGRSHKGLGDDSPMSRFEKFAEGGNGLAASGMPMPLEDSDKLTWDFLWEDCRIVNHLGIRFENRRYSCPKLTRLFSPNRRSSLGKVEFRFNPYRMKSIFIKVPDDSGREEIIEVPWIPENEKHRPTLENQKASEDPSIWEWDVLFADIRRGGTSNPTSGLVEGLHQQREEEAKADGSVAGAPDRKSRIRDNRNRGMRDNLAQENLPAVVDQPAAGVASSGGVSDVPEHPPKKPRHKRLPTPVYLPVGDGADDY